MQSRALLHPKHDFFRLWMGLSISRFGDTLLTVWSISIIYSNSNSTLLVSLVFLSGLVPDIFFTLFAGSVVDIYEPKRVLRASSFLQALCVAPLLLIKGDSGDINTAIAIIIVCNFVQSVFNTLMSVSVTVLIPETVQSGDLPRANSLLSLSSSICGILGFAVGGVILSLMGSKVVILFDMASFAAVIITVGLVNSNCSERPKRRRLNLKFLFDGIATIYRSRLLRLLIMWAAFGNLAIAPIMTSIPQLAFESRGLINPLSWYYVSFFTGTFLGSLVSSVYPIRHFSRTLIYSGFGLVLCLAVLSRTDFAFFHISAIFLLSISVIYSSMTVVTLIQGRTEREVLGRVASSFDILAKSILGLAFLATGIASTLVPLRWIFIFSIMAISLTIPVTYKHRSVIDASPDVA